MIKMINCMFCILPQLILKTGFPFIYIPLKKIVICSKASPICTFFPESKITLQSLAKPASSWHKASKSRVCDVYYRVSLPVSAH